jgi:hypothetical protein
MAASESAALCGSSRPACGSLNSGKSRGPTASSSTITGTPSRNTEPHQKYSSTIPPSNGPMAAPTEKLVTQIPMATVRCSGSRNMLRMRDSVDGARVAPATPSSARLTMSISALVEKAATTDATPKAAAPISSKRRRPIRSPSVPIVISDPATRNP